MLANLCIIVCPFLKKEVHAAIKLEGIDDVNVYAYPPRCHGQKLQSSDLDRILPENSSYSRAIVVGSYCLDAVIKQKEVDSKFKFHRLEHCFSLVADPDLISRQLQNGSYLLSPGWLACWRSHSDNWGFSSDSGRDIAREFFGESARQLVLLETGSTKNSLEKLSEFSEFCGLPFESIHVGSGYLRLLMSKLILDHKLQGMIGSSTELLQAGQQQMTDYAMVFEVLGDLAEVLDEDVAINSIVDLFSTLFAPGILCYLPVHNGQFAEMITHSSTSETARAKTLLENNVEVYEWTESARGFIIQFIYQHKTVGKLLVDDIAFPEHKDHYLNLALSIVSVAGLAINNARNFKKLGKQKNKLAETLKELQDAQQQLVESEKMAALGSLVAGVAHEINTPVGNSIIAASTILDRGGKILSLFKNKKMSRNDLEEFISSTEKAAKLLLSNLKRTGDLVRSFKNISVDQTNEKSREFGIKEYLEDVIRSMTPGLKSKAIQFNLDCADDLMINSFPGVFAQIFSNLIANSVLHGFPEKNNGNISIIIKIVPIKHIFQPFSILLLTSA
jgi:hypothetical protein